MKGSVVVLAKGAIQVKTEFLDSKTVVWPNEAGQASHHSLIQDGYTQLDNVVVSALQQLESLWDRSRWGQKVQSSDLEFIIKTLRKY